MNRLLIGSLILALGGCAPSVQNHCDTNACPDDEPWTFTSHGGQAQALALAVDAVGAVYAAGEFRAADLGAGLDPSASGAFLSKLDPDGGLAWVVSVPGNLAFTAVAVDPVAGQIVVAGALEGATTISGRAVVPDGPSAPLVAAFDSDGALRWATALRSAEYTMVSSVSIHPSGAIGVGGTLLDATDLAAYVGELDSAGEPLFERAFSSKTQGWTEAMTYGVAFDAAGSLWATGWLSGDVWFDDHEISSGGGGSFVAKLSAAGDVTWARSTNGFGAVRTSHLRGVEDGVALVGNYSGAPDFGQGPLVASTVGLPFVAVLDDGGHVTASAALACDGMADAASVDVDAAGGLVLTGLFSGSFHAPGAASSDSYAIFVARLDASLTPRSIRTFGGGSNQVPDAVAVDPADRVLLGGGFNATLDLGSGRHTNRDKEGSAMFVAKLPAE